MQKTTATTCPHMVNRDIEEASPQLEEMLGTHVPQHPACTEPGTTSVATRGIRCLQGATMMVSAWLLLSECAPGPFHRWARVLYKDWPTQQLALIGLTSCLAVLLASVSHHSDSSGLGGQNAATRLLILINLVPNILAAATSWLPLAIKMYCEDTVSKCDYTRSALDAIGLASARVARIDLALCLLLAARGNSTWLLRVSKGWLGYAEAIPLHRTSGWWCVFQSVLHGCAYLLFYLHAGGWHGLWVDCFPVSRDDGELNRLGLINWFGLVSLFILGLLGVTALPIVRRLYYHVFQRLHLPLSLAFLICVCLHDLPIFAFTFLGFACWYFGKSSRCCSSSLSARALILPGTSGPWVEVTIKCGDAITSCEAPRGEWVSMQIVPLGIESHPLSVFVNGSGQEKVLSAIVSSKAGDWSSRVAKLALSETESFQVSIDGPFPTGGGNWSLSCGQDRALLLVAGGTGLNGWLAGLAAAAATGRRCHLVWCVQQCGDYLALAGQLPSVAHIRVTVYVTRASSQDLQLVRRVPYCGEITYETNTQAKQSLLVLVLPLASTVAALLIEYWWNQGWYNQQPSDTGLSHYTLSHRLLPIILMLVPMFILWGVTSCKVARVLSQGRPLDCIHCDIDGHTLQNELASPVHDEAVRVHDLKLDRPNLEAIVQEAATSLKNQNLVVAVCGPMTLVNGTEKAVILTRKECPSVDIEFCGSSSSW